MSKKLTRSFWRYCINCDNVPSLADKVWKFLGDDIDPFEFAGDDTDPFEVAVFDYEDEVDHIPQSFPAYLDEQGEIVPVCQVMGMRKGRTKEFIATLQGRSLNAENIVCLTCGAINAKAYLNHFPIFFRFISGILALLTTTLILLIFLITVFVSIFIGFEEGFFSTVKDFIIILILLGIPIYLGAFFLAVPLSFYVHLRYGTKRRELAYVKCKNCGSDKFTDLASATESPVNCPRCNRNIQQIQEVNYDLSMELQELAEIRQHEL